MGIKAKCNNCTKIYELPDCPNSSKDKYEALAFGIYTIIGNESVEGKWSCYHCRNK